LSGWPVCAARGDESDVRATPRFVSDTRSVAAAASAAGHAGHHFAFDAGLVERVDLFLRAPEHHRVAAFSRTTTSCVRAASTSARLMKRCSGRTLPVALAHVHELARSASASVSGRTRRRGRRCPRLRAGAPRAA
jgi:hypothetical protein